MMGVRAMLLWAAAALCAFFVKGLCGFANTLVFTTVLSFGHSNVSITPVELLLGYPSNIIMVIRERRSIRWSMCLPLAFLVILGSIPGAFLLKTADTGTVKVIFGSIIILLGIEMLLRQLHPGKLGRSRLLLGIIGLLSGLLCGLYGVGALLGAYVHRVAEDSHAFRANLCFVFLAENTFRILLYSLWGIITADIVRRALLLVPFMLVGLALGICSGKHLNEKIAGRIVTVMLIFSGAALILQNL